MRQKSIIHGDSEDICYICGKHGRTELHHMLHGSYRSLADKYGLTCHLCPECHRALHDAGVHDRDLQQMAQREYERKYGAASFRAVFGRSWL